jgi:hypothetical protein
MYEWDLLSNDNKKIYFDMNFTTLMNKNYEELVFNLIFPRKNKSLGLLGQHM